MDVKRTRPAAICFELLFQVAANLFGPALLQEAPSSQDFSITIAHSLIPLIAVYNIT
jgi:hypothetical protein